ncbi:MAG: CSLREA domain-containing protein [Geminicoccaceae bacterium]
MTLPYSGMFDEEASRLALASTNTPLVVTTVDDIVDASDGVLSLREAVTLANETQGLDSITFSDDIAGETVTLRYIGDLSNAQVDRLTITDDIAVFGGSAQTETTSINGALFMTSDVGIAHFEDLGISDRISMYSSDPFISRAAHSELENVSISGGGQIGGSAIWGGYGSLSIKNSVISWGGEYTTGISSDGPVEIIDSTISASGTSYTELLDSSMHFGGDLFISGSALDMINLYAMIGMTVDADLVIENSTLLAPGDLPAIVLTNAGEAVLDHVTIAGMSIPSFYFPERGAMLITEESSLTLKNSLVTGSYADYPTTVDRINSYDDSRTFIEGGGTFIDGGGNVLSDRDGVTNADVYVNLRGPWGFPTLKDYGGPTPTLALLDDPSNPAIGAAIPSGGDEVDQRGFTRDAAPDAGAFEAGAGTPPLIPLPELHEKVAVAEDDINGIVNSNFIIGKDGDAVITFLDEYAGYQNTLGVYLVGTRSTISDVRIVFDRIEHAQASDEASASARPGGGPLDTGDSVALSELYDEGELHEGTQFGLFLISDGASRNDASVFHSGHLEFRDGDDAATMSSYRPPELVHVADDGSETTVAGPIMHVGQAGTTRYGNGLNPDRGVQTISGLYDPENRLLAIEDKPVAQSDADFNDLIISVDLAPDSGTLIA